MQVSNKDARLGESKTPASALTDRGRDRLAEGVDVTKRSNVDGLRRQLIAVEFLELAARDVTQAKLTQDRYIRLAKHEYRLSNQTIGEALGVSEARVRQMLKALESECWNCGDDVVSGGLCAGCNGGFDGGDK